MAGRRLLYLSRADVAAVGPDPAATLRLLEAAFLEKARGRAETPPKPGIHPAPDAFLHAMPASIPAMGAAGVKWVAAYSGNPARGLPIHHGAPHPERRGHGPPVLRNGRRLAHRPPHRRHHRPRRPDSASVGIVACGVQGRATLEALAAAFPLHRAYAFDINKAAQAAFVAEMAARLRLEVIGVDDAKAAVVDSDIVVTSGPILRHPQPTLIRDWLSPGAFACALDFDSAWTPEALRQMDRIATDDCTQFHHYKALGYFQHTPDPSSDLAALVAGTALGRRMAAERTVAVPLGTALADLAVAPEVHRRALAADRGTWLDL